MQRNVKKDGTTGQRLLVSNIQAFTDTRRQLLSHTSHYLLTLAVQQTAAQSGGKTREGVQGVMGGQFYIFPLAWHCWLCRPGTHISLSSRCAPLQALQRSPHRAMKPLSLTFTPQEGRAGQSQLAVTGLLGKPGREGHGQPWKNCKKDQDIPTMEQFVCESVRKELRCKVWQFQQRFKRKGRPSWAEREAVGCSSEK